MDEVSGPIIAIALVLVAVFVPIAFITGLTGEFYKQFALTIAISTVISAINSLTLSPALSALLLKPHGAQARRADARHGPASSAGSSARFNSVFTRSGNGYVRGVRGVLAHKASRWACSSALLGADLGLVPGRAEGLHPGAGQAVPGRIVQLPNAASLNRTEEVVRQRRRDRARASRACATPCSSPACRSPASPTARTRRIVFFGLDDFEERKSKELYGLNIAKQLNMKLSSIQEAQVVVFPPPPVQGLGTLGGFKLQLEDRADLGSDALYKATQAVLAKARQTPELTGVFSNYE